MGLAFSVHVLLVYVTMVNKLVDVHFFFFPPTAAYVAALFCWCTNYSAVSPPVIKLTDARIRQSSKMLPLFVSGGAVGFGF